jgi:prophage antirepressor-like protein
MKRRYVIMHNLEIKKITVPIVFESHEYGGTVRSIEEFTNIDFGIVRTVYIDNEPYFSAKDICRGLFIVKSRQAAIGAVNEMLMSINAGVSKQDPSKLYYYIETEITHKARAGYVTQKVKEIFISESILYILLGKSRKKEAILFRTWVLGDVLPDLRKIGMNNSMILLQELSNRLDNIDNNINSGFNNINNNMDNRFIGVNGNIVNGVNYIHNSNIDFQNFIIGKIQELLLSQGIDINDNNEIKSKIDNIIRGLCAIYKDNSNISR